MFTHNKIFTTLLVLTALSLTLGGCKKNFLDEPPRVQTIEDYFTTSNQAAREMVNAIYNKLYDWNIHSFPFIGMTEIAGDNASKGSDVGDSGGDKDQLDAYFFSPTSISFGDVWNGYFEGIARANKAIKFINELEIPEAQKIQYIAEARFLRAYFYFFLVRSFGEVPVIPKVPETEDEIAQTYIRSSIGDVYALIESDFQYALQLPSKQLVDLGRVSGDAARAFLAKTALYRKNYGQCASYCNELINSQEYKLLPDYSHIWREIGEFSEESIWEVNAKGSDPQKGILEYYVVQAPRGGSKGLGWGFNTPTQAFYDAYEEGDVRREATIIVSGQTLWDGWETDPNHTNPLYNYKSYVSRLAESWGQGDMNANKNLRVMRYAEVLLMAAESANELGDAPLACDYLNMVRSRAGLPDYQTTDTDSLRMKIWNERRFELAFEHDRVFDLRRQGRIGEVMKSNGIPFVDGKHELYPIPQRQIDLSAGKMFQNPGY